MFTNHLESVQGEKQRENIGNQSNNKILIFHLRPWPGRDDFEKSVHFITLVESKHGISCTFIQRTT